MSISGESRGLWSSVRHLPRRTPLRVKLITAVLTLVAIALVVISVAGLAFLRNYLLGQADTGVLNTADNNALLSVSFRTYVGTGEPYPIDGGAILWLPKGGKPHVVAQEINAAGLNSPPGSRSSGQTLKAAPQITPGASWLNGSEYVTVSATSGPWRYRVLAIPDQTGPGQNGPTTGTVVIALDVTSVYQTLDKLTAIDIIVSGILLVGLAVLGVAVIQTSLRPLTDIEQTADAIARGDLSRRVPERDPRTEIGRLGRSLNAMLAQIETAFHARSASERAARRSEDRMRQFVADASHELRTPLTAIRGFAEYYRQRGGVDLTGAAAGAQAALPPPSDTPDGTSNASNANGNGSGSLAPADLDRIMRRLEQESSRMGVLVEDMLLLARLDQQRPLEHRTVDLLTLAADAVHDARVVAPDRSINLTVGAGAALLVLGDEVRLRQVIGNLMSNALAHTPDGTPIDVRIRSGSLSEAPSYAQARPPVPPPGPPALGAEPRPDATEPGASLPGPVQPAASRPRPVHPAASGPRSAAVLEVADHGPGLSREQAEHAFERFYRADQARTTGGTGLGLAIVAALVAAHGGAVWVESAPGQGATFRIALPLAPEALHDPEADHDTDHDTEHEADHDTEHDSDHDTDHDAESAALGWGTHPGSEGEHGAGGG
ncbi:MAG: sensor histidine kinase [Streptosporangiaceae bacterium]